MSQEPQPPQDKLPSGIEDVLLCLALLLGSALFGRFYLQLMLSARSNGALLVGLLLFPAALLLGIGVWRTLVIPLTLLRLAGESLKHRSLSQGMDAMPTLLPGRFVFLVVPPLVCLTAGLGLGVVTELPLLGTAFHLGGLGTAWGVLLFVLAGRGYLHFVMTQVQ